jgi:hypothetical protein
MVVASVLPPTSADDIEQLEQHETHGSSMLRTSVAGLYNLSPLSRFCHPSF